MTSGGAEALKAAIRRSLPLILGLILLGIVAVNVFKNLQGPSYDASARVLISPTSLSGVITETEPSFVDPQREQTTALGIAEAPRVYEIAAQNTDGELGSAAELNTATRVTGDPASDLITFTSSDSEPQEAIAMVNAVADAFLEFRGELASSRIVSTIRDLEARLGDLPEGSPERNDFEAQIARLEVLREASSGDQLVEAADDATQTSPNLLRDSVVGFAIGLIAALIMVALREAVDTTVRTEGQVEELLSAPVLASVRSMPRRTRIVTYGRHEASFADTYALLAAQLATGEPGGYASVLAITSSIPEEGKTTTAANLAVSVARRGLHVILADFDFRKPGVSELFELPREAEGALQLMATEGREVEDVLWSVTLDGARPQVSMNGGSPDAALPRRREATGGVVTGSLRLLPSGGLIGSSKVPHQSRMRWLLRELRARADLVILDTPPALLTMEVAELAGMIDTVLVVVRQGRVSQRSLRALGRQAKAWPTDIAGAVMTDMRTEGDYSYYGGR